MEVLQGYHHHLFLMFKCILDIFINCNYFINDTEMAYVQTSHLLQILCTRCQRLSLGDLGSPHGGLILHLLDFLYMRYRREAAAPPQPVKNTGVHGLLS